MADYLNSLARGFAQGSSLGWADEGQAALEALLMQRGMPRATGRGMDVGAMSPYESNVQTQREMNAAAQAENPNTYLAGDIGGGIATGALLPGAGVAGSAAKALGTTAADVVGRDRELGGGDALGILASMVPVVGMAARKAGKAVGKVGGAKGSARRINEPALATPPPRFGGDGGMATLDPNVSDDALRAAAESSARLKQVRGDMPTRRPPVGYDETAKLEKYLSDLRQGGGGVPSFDNVARTAPTIPAPAPSTWGMEGPGSVKAVGIVGGAAKKKRRQDESAGIVDRPERHAMSSGARDALERGAARAGNFKQRVYVVDAKTNKPIRKATQKELGKGNERWTLADGTPVYLIHEEAAKAGR